MSAPEVSVVIPVSSADVRAENLVERYSTALRDGGYSFEFVFVLDGVAGVVVDELSALAHRWPVRLVRLQGGGLGESIALSAGTARAAGRFIVNAPQYLQVHPEDVLKVVRALESGSDCVSTWRHPRVDPWLNRLQSTLFNWMLRILMGIPFHDLNSGLRGFRRRVLEEVSVYGDLYRFLPVLALRQGFDVAEVQVRHLEEQGRRGFYGIGVYLRRLLDILAISFLTRFTQKPLRFFGALGLFFMLAGIAMCAEPLYSKLFLGDSMADRPLFVVGSILGIFGVQLIGFGLVGEIIIFTQAANLRDYKIEDADELEVPGLDEVDEEEILGRPEMAAPGGGAAPLAVPLAGPLAGPSAGPSAAGGSDGAELPVRVRQLVPGEDARWDAFVDQHPLGTFFHRSGWRRVVQEVFGHKPCDLVVERGREWLGALPLCEVRSMFTGHNLVSVPYAVYGGVLASTESDQQLLLDEAEKLARERKAGYVELRHLEARPGERPQSDLYVTFRCDLPDDPEKVLPSIPKKARAEVRRARDRFELQCKTTRDLDPLYRLFCENKRRLGSPSLPRRWFHGLLEEFGPEAVIHQVDDPSGEPLAAVMSFLHGDTVFAYYSGSKTGVNKTGVNDFIYCKIMEWGVENGFKQFDFGRSRRESGPARFKKNMGFEAERLHYDYLLIADGAKIPEFHPSNPKLALPRRMWSRMPQALARGLGGKLSRHLP